MTASAPGAFVVNGYLRTRVEATNLSNFLATHFDYLDRLTNRVYVEEEIYQEIWVRLQAAGFGAISATLSNGEINLSGYVPSDQFDAFQKIAAQIETVPGIRLMKTFVVPITADTAVIDLTGQYQVTGYSKLGGANINVVINGKIMHRGDTIDGMTVTSMGPNTIYLKKGVVKYKIQYNPG